MITQKRLYQIFFFIKVVLLLFITPDLFGQTTLSPGDIAVIGFRTSGGTDAITLLFLKELSCGTQFIVTDNNWDASVNTWSCNDDEFGVQITVTSIITAGTTCTIEVSAASDPMYFYPYGTATKTSLGNPWGTNFGLNSGGDNCFVLQGTRTSPSFIYGLRHVGTFASGGSCSSKDNTGLPAALTLGTSAIQMASGQNYWQHNCATLSAAIPSAFLTSIGNNTNWTQTAGACTYTITNAFYNPTGALGVTGPGCGCLSGCNLTTLGGPNCSGATGNCSAGQQSMSTDILVPAGCTYNVTATMRTWSGCSSSGADTGDKLKVDLPTGSKSFQTGASNAEIDDSYTLTGPGTIRVSGSADRADEIIVYRAITSPCSTCGQLVLPIELSRFNVSLIDNSVKISWATESEMNNDFFTIEKSENADNWQPLSIVPAQNNSSAGMRYSIYDYSPLKGISYYRLKQTDKNGKYTYSGVMYVDNETTGPKIIKRVNIYGQELDENAGGIIILIYDNGNVRKTFKSL